MEHESTFFLRFSQQISIRLCRYLSYPKALVSKPQLHPSLLCTECSSQTKKKPHTLNTVLYKYFNYKKK